MAALMVKVGALVLKTLAKPLSSRFQVYVMSHPVAREYTIAASQKLHRLEVWITRGAEGKSGKAFIADMTEEKSVELASKFASEGFVLVIGLAIVAFEYDRQQRKEVVKKAQEQQEKHDKIVQATLERQRLAEENQQQTQLISSLLERVGSLEGRLEALVGQAHQERAQQAAKKGWFGGFVGPKAAQA